MVNIILKRICLNFKRCFPSHSYRSCFGTFYFQTYSKNSTYSNYPLNLNTKCSFSTEKNVDNNKQTLNDGLKKESSTLEDTESTATSSSPESKGLPESNTSELKVVNREKSEGQNEDTKSDDKKFRFLPFGIYGGATLVFSGFALSYYIDRGNDIKDLKLSQILDDVTQYMYDRIEKSFPTDNSPLLPDFEELKYPPNLPTLVLDLDKVIAKMEYDRKLGWRVKKRPYADKFFKELINYYEIVIWSDDSYPVAYDIANLWGLPVIGCIHRDHCKKFKGGYIKDLSRLGRDLKRVILVDHDRIACTLQEENSILIKEFDGDENDEELLYLINLLKTIAINPQDVKVQIKQLGGGLDYLLGRRFAEQFSLSQEKAKSRMNMTKMLGFKHYQ